MLLTRRNTLMAAAASLLGPKVSWGDGGASEKPAVVLIYLDGGYNAVFSAADAYVPQNLFSCTASNVRDLGNGVVVDAATLGSLPASVLEKMCTVGVAHGASGHDFALRYAWYDGVNSFPLMLADALGGSAPFRCVHFGEGPARGAAHRAYNGVVMTAVPDLSAAITLTGPGAPDSTGPQRALMARSLKASLAMGADRFKANPNSLSKPWEGTHSLIGALEAEAKTGVDWPEISAAYGIPVTETSASTFKSHLAGAEMMIRGGSDVICITSSRVLGENWDTHGEGGGVLDRAMMSDILPSLSVFLQRTLAMTNRNVVTVLSGDFARIGGKGTASEHANGISASVFGKYIKLGTTGRFSTGAKSSDMFYKLPPMTPGYRGFRSLLTAATNAKKHPWGPNQHAALLSTI